MAEIKFLCPSCNQHITCDDAWSGHEIQCPICQNALTVPARAGGPAGSQGGSPLVPKPPSGAQTRLSTAVPAQKPATQGRAIPIRNLAPPPPKKGNLALKILQGVLIVAALGVGFYFGYGFIVKMQDKATAESEKMARESDGGQVGHIAELHSVLDATEPGGSGLPRGPVGGGPRGRPTGVGAEIPMGEVAPADGSAGTPKPAQPQLPVVPPQYDLNVGTAKIPESRVNGTVSGAEFVAEQVRLDRVGASTVLRFIQGAITSPDREVMVYLRLKAGEKVGGQKLTISSDMRGTGVPQIVKRWKTNPRYAPTMKTYGTGYAMKLELGEPAEGATTLPGRVIICLPDNEKTVVAGVFQAELGPGLGGEAVPGMVAPTPTGAEAIPSAEREMFQRRYGTPAR